MSKFPLIYVEWTDSSFFSGWHPLDEVDTTLIVCESVGFLIQEMEDRLLLSGTVGNNESANGLHTIPKVAITRRKIIKQEEDS